MPELPNGAPRAEQVFGVDDQQFDAVALHLFHYQYAANPIYNQYCNYIGVRPHQVQTVDQIPFLPISFFKTHNVSCTPNSIAELYFESSGTTGLQASRHYVPAPKVYEESFLKAFTAFFGAPTNYCILGLLPSYLERQHSSLVYMVNRLVEESGHADSGFYLHNTARLSQTLQKQEVAGQKTILFGVTYALLDFAAAHPQPLAHTTLVETGGMKGRRTELLRTEVHDHLKKAFGLSAIASEYGMTELLSQAYALADGHFAAPPWMRVLIRPEDDPFGVETRGRSGGINVIDLANMYSCAFIATEDVGRLNPDGTFDVMGRFDAAAVRGCSLLAL